MQRIIDKKDLQNKIGELLNNFEVIGTKELPNKGIFYQKITNAQDLYLGERFAVEPIKKFFLEPSSWVLKQSYNKEYAVETIPQTDRKRIIIGTRPCEARGLVLLDKIFDSDYKDGFYVNNRTRTIIIGLACSRPDRSCFCTSMGGSPVEGSGMDALLFAVGDRFIMDIITEKAEELFGLPGESLDKAKEDPPQLDKEKMKRSLELKIDVPESLDKIFESDYWDAVSRPCISCGVCTYLCPTCHCFDLVDEKRKKLRCYDGCSFPDFTLETSGVNPRPTKRERYRQRVFHKFDYFKKNFGENLCVGCGRCIRCCPVKIDIARIVDRAPLSKKD